ncbi:MAG: hypothetical protein HUU38_04195, partial [Anaerolineales bacterium]|nr:hypothetical protein [Anaerolineales bacterium]
MKTFLIPLDPHDDILSVRDKMAWGKTTRLLLIWPETDAPIFDRRLDLLLLKRRALELGAQLAFVTRDPEVKSHARDLGIPVFRTSREAQAAHWRVPREINPLDILRRLRALHGPKITTQELHRALRPSLAAPHTLPYHVSRFTLFLLAILSVAALAALIFPSATITLTPATQAQ